MNDTNNLMKQAAAQLRRGASRTLCAVRSGAARILRTARGVAKDLRQELQIYPAIAGQLRSRSVRFNIMMDLVLMALISVALANFCISREGGLDLYMTTFLPMLGVTAGFFLVTEAIRGSRSICLAVAVLILTGVAIQIILMLSAGDTEDISSDRLVQFAVISILFALAALPVLSYLSGDRPSRSTVIIILNTATVLLYLALLVLGRSINSTRAWISLGSFQFQLTEPIKVIALMTMALCFRNEQKAADQRLMAALITLAINGCFLLVINELGTLCVLGAVFFCLGLIYLPSVKKLLVIIALLFLAVALVLMICSGCYNMKYPPADDAEAGTVQEPAEVNQVVDLGAKIYSKFKLRIDLVLDPESVDQNAGGYQNRKAQESLILSNWFGSAAEVYIPVAESDYVFCYLILKMGVCFGIAVLVLLLIMLFQGILSCLACTAGAQGAVATAFVCGIAIQSLIAAASSTGYFITIGLPFAFLADGGSAILTNYTMVLFILYATRRHPVVPARVQQSPIHRKER